MVDNSLIYVPAGKSGILLSFGGREALTSEAYQHMVGFFSQFVKRHILNCKEDIADQRVI